MKVTFVSRVKMKELGSRLKELRKSRNIGQKTLADMLGISLRAYQFYESGAYDPALPNLIALADYFQVSIDYLVGRSDTP